MIFLTPAEAGSIQPEWESRQHAILSINMPVGSCERILGSELFYGEDGVDGGFFADGLREDFKLWNPHRSQPLSHSRGTE